MSTRLFVCASVLVLSLSVAVAGSGADLQKGTPDIKSMGAIAFSPEGVLFVGDSEGAAVFAIDVADRDVDSGKEPFQVERIDQKVAAALGTTADQIRINDMAIHPASQKAYLSVRRGAGNAATHVLLQVHKSGQIDEVSLVGIDFAKASISNPPSTDAKNRRGRRLRTDSITDLAYSDGIVYVAGLSNEEFASALRKIPYPFTGQSQASSLEIYHVAHRQYETHAPIRTFMPFTMDDKPHIVASYTCTPLVVFPTDDLSDGDHVKGRTVAELGAGNSPLDIIAVERGDESYILMANSNRPVMKIDAKDVARAQSLTQPLEKRFGTSGVDYISLPRTGVLQLADLNDDHIVMIQRAAGDGTLNLVSLRKQWIFR